MKKISLGKEKKNVLSFFPYILRVTRTNVRMYKYELVTFLTNAFVRSERKANEIPFYEWETLRSLSRLFLYEVVLRCASPLVHEHDIFPGKSQP